MTRLLINVAGFYAGWFACVLGAANGRPLLGPAVLVVVLAVHLMLHPGRRREVALLLMVTIVGTLVDTQMLLAGVLRFEGGTEVTPVFLLWIAALWANLAAVLSVCLRWLARWLWLALVLGAVGGPATYWAGAELGALGLHEQPWISFAALAAEWAILMPAFVWFADKWHNGGRRERVSS